MKLKVRLHDDWTKNSIGILLYSPDIDGEIHRVAVPIDGLIFRELREGEIIGGPTLSLPRETLQSLIDELYKDFSMLPTFLRSQFKESDKILEATKYHLEDMRQLVFRVK